MAPKHTTRVTRGLLRKPTAASARPTAAIARPTAVIARDSSTPRRGHASQADRESCIATVVTKLQEDWHAYCSIQPHWKDNPITLSWLRPRLLKLRSLCHDIPAPPSDDSKLAVDRWHEEVFSHLTIASKQCLERITGYSRKRQEESLLALSVLSFNEHCMARYACEVAGSVQEPSKRLLSIDGNEEDETPMVCDTFNGDNGAVSPIRCLKL